jgi:hypothetical protein
VLRSTFAGFHYIPDFFLYTNIFTLFSCTHKKNKPKQITKTLKNVTDLLCVYVYGYVRHPYKPTKRKIQFKTFPCTFFWRIACMKSNFFSSFFLSLSFHSTTRLWCIRARQKNSQRYHLPFFAATTTSLHDFSKYTAT